MFKYESVDKRKDFVMSLAPVVIFTFNRLKHTKKTIEALKKNILASESDIYIYSDGARNKEEEKKVNEVRQYLKEVDGFKSVSVIEAQKNKGLANSVINGVTEIINQYGRVIVLEDDLVASKYFLEYMNEALNLYGDREDIWSISGYIPNVEMPDDYNNEVCLIRRGSSWGWGTWKDRWNLNDWDVLDYNDFKKNRKKNKAFNEAGGDLSYMLEDQMKGRINSWAIRWVYSQYKKQMWSVYPTKSFVKNIGTDLSGTHSSSTDKYEVELTDKMIKLNIKISVNKVICNNFKKFYDLTFSGYIAVFIKKIGLYKQARKIRNTIISTIKIRK